MPSSYGTCSRILVEEIIAGFYNNTRRSSAGFMLDDATIERLKVRQKQHWQSLFSSEFDEKVCPKRLNDWN